MLGTPDKVALAERVVIANDKAKGEVMIEITILDVSTNKVKEYGLTLSNYGAGVSFAPTGNADERGSDGLTSVRAHLLSSMNLADFVVSVPTSVFAKFLQTDSSSRILAAPRLRAAEGKKTSLKIGREVPVPVTTFQATQTGSTTFSPATSFQYRNVGVNLDITPKVNPSGDISLELTAEFSVLGPESEVGGQRLPTFLTRNVTGVLRLRDGETSLIGGLLQKAEADSFTGVLGLQSIPILNKVFTSRRKAGDDNEILISITPHILRAPKVVEDDLTGMVVGTEEIIKVEGARPPLFGPISDAPAPGAPLPSTGAPRPGSVAAPVVPPTAAPQRPAPPAATPQAAAPAPQALPPAFLPPNLSPELPSEGPPAASASPQAPTAAAPADPRRVTAQLTPADVSLKIGESTVVTLIVMGLRDATSLEVIFTLDGGLEIEDASAGSLLTLDGVAVGLERAFEPGRVRVKLTRPTGVSGAGAVVVLRFRGSRAASGTILIESLALTGPSGVERPSSVTTARFVVNP